MKKGGQKHQNTYKFKHNKNSVKTEKIKNSPLDMLCQRCYDIIKWKIDYRKYKPLTAPSKCNICTQRTIIKAYRTICDHCAYTAKHPETQEPQRLCTKCCKDTTAVQEDGTEGEGYATFSVSKKVRSEEQDHLE